MSNHQEDYVRSDLSGIVVDMGDMFVNVRFIEHGSRVMNCRMVVRADGCLAIDPSGLPVPREPREQARATDLKLALGMAASDRVQIKKVPAELPEGEEVVDAELVDEA